MAELATLARPYARAVFEFALASNALDQWARILDTLAVTVIEPRVRGLLGSPALTAAEKASHMTTLCAEELNDAGRNFLTLLAENRRLSLLPQIRDVFQVMKANQEKSVDLEVMSAFEIDPAQASKLAEAVGALLQRSVNINTQIDKSLIGGVVVRAGDLVVDGSVRGKLARLAAAMHS